MSSYFSNLTSYITNPTSNQSYRSLSKTPDDTKSLTQYTDAVDSDEEDDWRMNMLHEEIKDQKMTVYHGGRTSRLPPGQNEENAAFSTSPKNAMRQNQASRMDPTGGRIPRHERTILDTSSDEDDEPRIIVPSNPHTATNSQDRLQSVSQWWSGARNGATKWIGNTLGRNSQHSQDEDLLAEENPVDSQTQQQPQSVTGRLKSLVNEASKKVGLSREPERPKKWYERWMETINKKITLSRRTRLYGFAITFIIGLCLMGASLLLLSYALVPMIARLFALTYTLAQISFILSSFFLAGPITQIKQMVTPKRIIPSTIYLVSLFLTVVSAIRMKSIVLCFILIIVQVLALVFYFFTYIPYSETLLNMMVRGVWNSL